MMSRNRTVRVAAAVGATVAAGAVAMLAATTTASADEPGRCLQNVNIREEPDVDSRIVALCEAGTQVKLGAERDGFVRIDDLGGWASKDYVKADESAPSSDDRSSSSSDHNGDHNGDHDGDHDGADQHRSSGSDHSDSSDRSGADRSGGDESGEAGGEEAGTGGDLGGLLG